MFYLALILILSSVNVLVVAFRTKPIFGLAYPALAFTLLALSVQGFCLLMPPLNDGRSGILPAIFLVLQTAMIWKREKQSIVVTSDAP
jgi:hypothetical protein